MQNAFGHMLHDWNVFFSSEVGRFSLRARSFSGTLLNLTWNLFGTSLNLTCAHRSYSGLKAPFAALAYAVGEQTLLLRFCLTHSEITVAPLSNTDWVEIIHWHRWIRLNQKSLVRFRKKKSSNEKVKNSKARGNAVRAGIEKELFENLCIKYPYT